MNQRTNQILFTLLRSAICGTALLEEEKQWCSEDILPRLISLSIQHDVVHLLALGLKKNHLLDESSQLLENEIFKAVYRYEQKNYELNRICETLEEAQIPFMPLKGSVLRKYYPEPWMRTSCDIDILVHREDWELAILYLKQRLQYRESERATHDVSLFSPTGVHVELHFDLVEEGRANNAIEVLSGVWQNAILYDNSGFQYEMSDAFFYFYHIAHMAKHFETGGCGIRPFLDLWILDHMEGVETSERDKLLSQGNLLKFANVSRTLSGVWFGDCEADELSLRMQEFILRGGVYGSADNRVLLQQKKRGGRVGYFFSRVFIPYHRLKRYYPVLEKHRWLTPVMQVRRWFMIFQPDVAKMAKQELSSNRSIETSQADEMNDFLNDIGL